MLCGARHFVGAVSDRDAPEVEICSQVVEFRCQALNFKVADRSYRGLF